MRKFDDLLPSEAHLNAMLGIDVSGPGAAAAFLRQSIVEPATQVSPIIVDQAVEQLATVALQRQEAKEIAAKADALEVLQKAGWLTQDLFEFSAQYRAVA